MNIRLRVRHSHLHSLSLLSSLSFRPTTVSESPTQVMRGSKKGNKNTKGSVLKHIKKRQAVEAFLSFNPPEYVGSTDPSKTFNWLVDIEQIFDYCGCDEQYKVQLAVRMLRGWAFEWWSTFSNGKTNALNMDWKDFMHRMKKDFFLGDHLIKLEREFLLFEKNEYMSVEEYAHEFVKKMKFVKHMVSHESDKIYHFTEGLPRPCREYVGKATTLTQAIFRAKDVEQEYWGLDVEEEWGSSSHEQTSEDDDEEEEESGKTKADLMSCKKKLGRPTSDDLCRLIKRARTRGV